MPQTATAETAETPGKRIHRRVMVGMGLMTVAFGLTAAYIAWSRGGLPALFYGPARERSAPTPGVRLQRRSSIEWLSWETGLAEARRMDRLILLNLTNGWSRSCRQMEDDTYGDPAVAAWVAAETVPVRVDADSRPDIALRYLSGGWPTTALLLPTGEILATGTYIPPDRFLPWALSLTDGYRKNRSEVEAAQASAAEARARTLVQRAKSGPQPDSSRELERTRVALLADWDPGSSGFGKGPRFPHFLRIGALLELDQSWAAELAGAAWKSALRLEDPVWGGFYRYGASGWDDPEHEKLLADQAEALAVAAQLDPAAASRTLVYIDRFLSDSAGGWYAGQPAHLLRQDGRIVEGRLYYALAGGKRRALGIPAPDRRIFVATNARTARALLEAATAASTYRAHALITLDRLWREGVTRDGDVRHELSAGSPAGLLEDRVALAQALLAAHQATGQPIHLDCAKAVVLRLEADLLDPVSKAFFDRPARKELPEGMDQVLEPALNAQAASLYLRLILALKPWDPARRRALDRASGLLSWLSARSGTLDPAVWASLTRRAHP